MNFFLLKWIFNAIKLDSANDNPVFLGKSYVSKTDLVKQLSKNHELMNALGYEDQRQVSDSLKLASSKKDGYLMWPEFLDFFFMKDMKQHERFDGNDWWN